MRYIFIFSLLAFFKNTGAQTCIIARKHGTAIYIGADSRSTYTVIDPITRKRSVATSDLNCKIRQSGKFVVAAAGYPGMDIMDTIVSITQEASDFPVVIARLRTQAILTSFENMYTRYHRSYPRYTADSIGLIVANKKRYK